MTATMLDTVIPLGLVDEHPDNLRTVFDDASLDDLASSIKGVGLINPITVVADGTGRFTVVAGHRRLRAYGRAFPDATTIPAVMSVASDLKQATALMIVENVQRADILPVDEARGYLRLTADHKVKVKDLAKMVGRSVAHIQERLSLLTLPDDLHPLIGSTVPLTVASKLAKVQDPKSLKDLAKEAKGGKLPDWKIDNVLRSERHKAERDLMVKHLEKMGVKFFDKITDSGVSYHNLERLAEFDASTVKSFTYDPAHVHVLLGPRLSVHRILTDDEVAEKNRLRAAGVKADEEMTPWHAWRDQMNDYEDLVDEWNDRRFAEWGPFLRSLSTKQLQTGVLEYVLADTAGTSKSRFHGYAAPHRVCAMLGIESEIPNDDALSAYMTDMTTTLHVYVARRVIVGAGDDSVIGQQYEDHLRSVGLDARPEMPAHLAVEPWQDGSGAWITDRPEPEDTVSPDDHLESAYEDLTHLEDDEDFDNDYDFEYEGESPVDYD
jgi:ParB/RepB/Spo0J family partition protein